MFKVYALPGNSLSFMGKLSVNGVVHLPNEKRVKHELGLAGFRVNPN